MTTQEKQQIVMKGLQDEFGIIENIPSEIGLYNSRPIFIEDAELKWKNIHVADREREGVRYLVRQWSPSWRQKDKDGYYYVVDYRILNDDE